MLANNNHIWEVLGTKLVRNEKTLENNIDDGGSLTVAVICSARRPSGAPLDHDHIPRSTRLIIR